MENKIKENKLKNNIKLWGFKSLDFIKKYYQESVLYIMTSHEESFGLVIIEAMSFGVPCITFDSAKGALDCINKETGFIIKNRNKEEMIETIINYLNLSKKEKNSLGKNARMMSKNYKFENVKKEWLEFLKGL